jgi:thiol-disulfide isomerase/thioredoxin
MTDDDEYYVGTCTHINESNIEYETSSPRRISWLRQMEKHGLKVKVALFDNVHAGFIYITPIEINPWHVQGRDIMVFPCLVSQSKSSLKGVGKKLIEAAEEESIKQHHKGIATIANFWDYSQSQFYSVQNSLKRNFYYYDFWFNPAKYFENLGCKIAERRGIEAILWKQFDPSADPPQFREIKYKFNPIQGKVVVDLFWNVFCLTSDVEAQRVREVVSEYKNDVVFNEYSAVDLSILKIYGISRGIYVNGKLIEVGPEIEKNILRQEIEDAMIKQQAIK